MHTHTPTDPLTPDLFVWVHVSSLSLAMYICMCMHGCVCVCVWVWVCVCVCDSTQLQFNWPHSPQTSRWQNKQRQDKRKTMVRLLLSKQCLDIWQTAIIRPIHPFTHPSHPAAGTSFMCPYIICSFHQSSMVQCTVLQKVNCRISLLFLTTRKVTGWLFCRVSCLNPGTSIRFKLHTWWLPSTAVLHGQASNEPVSKVDWNWKEK